MAMIFCVVDWRRCAALLAHDRQRAVDLDHVVAGAVSAPPRQHEVAIATANGVGTIISALHQAQVTARSVMLITIRGLSTSELLRSLPKQHFWGTSAHTCTRYNRHGYHPDLRQGLLTLHVERPGGVRQAGAHRRVRQHSRRIPTRLARDARALGRTARGAGHRRRRRARSRSATAALEASDGRPGAEPRRRQLASRSSAGEREHLPDASCRRPR